MINDSFYYPIARFFIGFCVVEVGDGEGGFGDGGDVMGSRVTFCKALIFGECVGLFS